MSTKSRRAEDDQFFSDHEVLMRAGADAETVNTAAASAVAYAIRHGDRLAWAFLLARFEELVEHGDSPPQALLEGLAGVFKAFRAGASMDEAFGLRKASRGRPDSLAKRAWAQTNASLVENFIRRGMTLELALEAVYAFRQGEQSEAQIKRDYYAWRKTSKRTNGE